MIEQTFNLVPTISIIIASIWWFRKESRDDIKEFRRECREDWIRSQNTIDAIQHEIKDFHERLIDIEKRRN